MIFLAKERTKGSIGGTYSNWVVSSLKSHFWLPANITSLIFSEIVLLKSLLPLIGIKYGLKTGMML